MVQIFWENLKTFIKTLLKKYALMKHLVLK